MQSDKARERGGGGGEEGKEKEGRNEGEEGKKRDDRKTDLICPFKFRKWRLKTAKKIWKENKRTILGNYT